MTLIPEKNVGIFLACNTESGAGVMAEEIKDRFLDRYFPSKAPEVPRGPNPTPESLKKFEGKYRPVIYCHSCPTGTSYVTTPFEVKVTDDGMLTAFGGRWKQLEPLLFVRDDGRLAGRTLLGFKEDSKGDIAYMFQNTYFVTERVR